MAVAVAVTVIDAAGERASVVGGSLDGFPFPAQVWGTLAYIPNTRRMFSYVCAYMYAYARVYTHACFIFYTVILFFTVGRGILKTFVSHTEHPHGSRGVVSGVGLELLPVEMTTQCPSQGP